MTLSQARRQLTLILSLCALLMALMALMALEDLHGDPLPWVISLAGALLARGQLLRAGRPSARGAQVSASAALTLAAAAAAALGWSAFREVIRAEPLPPSLALALIFLLALSTRLSILAEHEREEEPHAGDAGHLTLTAWHLGMWRDLSAPSRALLVTPLCALLISWALEAWAEDPAALDARLALPYLWTLALISAALLWGVSRARRLELKPRREAPERLSTAEIGNLFSGPPAPRPPVSALSLPPAPLPPAPTPPAPTPSEPTR